MAITSKLRETFDKYVWIVVERLVLMKKNFGVL